MWVGEDKLKSVITSLARAFSPRVQDPVTFVQATRVLPLVTKDGVQIDLIFGQLPYEQEAIRRAATERIHAVDVRVCQPEDLVIHKLVSERPQDREDVRGIIQLQAARLDRTYLDAKVAALASELGRSDIMTWYEQCWREASETGV